MPRCALSIRPKAIVSGSPRVRSRPDGIDVADGCDARVRVASFSCSARRDDAQSTGSFTELCGPANGGRRDEGVGVAASSAPVPESTRRAQVLREAQPRSFPDRAHREGRHRGGDQRTFELRQHRRLEPEDARPDVSAAATRSGGSPNSRLRSRWPEAQVRRVWRRRALRGGGCARGGARRVVTLPSYGGLLFHARVDAKGQTRHGVGPASVHKDHCASDGRPSGTTSPRPRRRH